MLAEERPEAVVLCGIAGAYGETLRTGDTVAVVRERMAGVPSVFAEEYAATMRFGGLTEVAANTVANVGEPADGAQVENMEGAVVFAVCESAGVRCGEIRAVCRWSQEMLPDGTLVRREGVSQGFGYRTSVFQHTDGVIIRACFALQPGDPGIIRETMRELMTRRTVSQPLDLPSAGSAFKRPQGGYAAALIESAGLKGLTVGGAQVSEKHAGFVVNRGGATAADVLELLRQVQQRVLEHSGIRLEPEIRLWD